MTNIDKDIILSSKPNKERNIKKQSMRTILILISILFLSSCSLFNSAYDLAKENVDITWKFDKTKDLKIVDSIVVISKPVYFIEYIDNLIDGEDKTIIKDGYSIWQLRTGNKVRIEVQKLDSTIYIYKATK